MATTPSSGSRVDFRVASDWGAGFTGELTLTNFGPDPIAGWQLEFAAPFRIDNLWNGRLEPVGAGRYRIADQGWNAVIEPGGSVTVGFQAGAFGGPPHDYLLNGIPQGDGPPPGPLLTIDDAVVVEGDAGRTTAHFQVSLSSVSTEDVTVTYKVAGLEARVGRDFVDTHGTVVIAAGETMATIPVAVLGDTRHEGLETFEVRLSKPEGAVFGDRSALGRIVDDDVPGGFLSTAGNQIVDAAGEPVRLTGVNWFGLETATLAPHGLGVRGYQEMMDQMAGLGFNAIRLPFSNELLHTDAQPSGIDFGLNPDLAGLSGLEIMDRIIEYAGQVGLRVILDDHRIGAGDGSEATGLWYGAGQSEAEWIADWTSLAERYLGNPTVAGADLFNEPHGDATWGDPAHPAPTDWNLAATRAGDAIHGVNPDWLILVEGVSEFEGDRYWWGGHLGGVRDHPIDLQLDGKLVYAPHAYPNSVFPQPWFAAADFPANLPEIWTDHWGFIQQQEIAPVLLGEFGSRLEDASDVAWMDGMLAYLQGDLDGDGSSDLAPGDLGISWTWWSWNPNSGDTGGILADDWTTVVEAKLDRLEPLLSPLSSSDILDGADVPLPATDPRDGPPPDRADAAPAAAASGAGDGTHLGADTPGPSPAPLPIIEPGALAPDG